MWAVEQEKSWTYSEVFICTWKYWGAWLQVKEKHTDFLTGNLIHIKPSPRVGFNTSINYFYLIIKVPSKKVFINLITSSFISSGFICFCVLHCWSGTTLASPGVRDSLLWWETAKHPASISVSHSSSEAEVEHNQNKHDCFCIPAGCLTNSCFHVRGLAREEESITVWFIHKNKRLVLLTILKAACRRPLSKSFWSGLRPLNHVRLNARLVPLS